VPVRSGSEEYLDSEKYEARKRSLDGPLLPLVGALNRARRAEPALQVVDNLRWLETENDALVGYAKDDVVCVVNVDPHLSQAGACVIPVALRFPPAFPVRDLVTGDTFTWRAGRNYVELPPGGSHVLKVGA
jgi:starch synthase (maltosyl-transferring)